MKLIGCSLSVFFRFVLPTAIACFLAMWVCDIEPGEKYRWASGIWHGIFVVPNFIRHIISHNVRFMADNGTEAYYIFFWLITIATVITLAMQIVNNLKKLK